MAHARRYHWKALPTDPERAGHALALLGALFKLERALATSPPEERRRVRQEKSKPILEEYFAWCDREADVVLDETPISRAIGYSRNQRVALSRFLEDGRLPMSNNLSYAARGIREVMPSPGLCRVGAESRMRARAATAFAHAA